MSASLSSALTYCQANPVATYLMAVQFLSGAAKLAAPHSFQRIFLESHAVLIWRLTGLGEVAIAVGILKGIALAITYEYMFLGAVLYTLSVYPPALPPPLANGAVSVLMRLLLYVPALITLAAAIRLYIETAADPDFIKPSAQIYFVGNIVMGLASGIVGASTLASSQDDDDVKTTKAD